MWLLSCGFSAKADVVKKNKKKNTMLNSTVGLQQPPTEEDRVRRHLREIHNVVVEAAICAKPVDHFHY